MASRQLWLGGWGVAPETVRDRLACAFPGAEITVLAPGRAAMERVCASPDDVALGGWSLGARLLLETLATGNPALAGRRLTLVCPFLAFPEDAGQGGRVSGTQVKFLRRWLAKDAPAALGDFYRRAGLNLPAPDTLPYSLEELDEGLALLAGPAPLEQPAIGGLPAAILLAGARDPLIDNAVLKTWLPGLRVLPEAGHDLADFMTEIRWVATSGASAVPG